MALQSEQEAQVLKHIADYRAKGYSDDRIRAALVDKGVDTPTVQRLMKQARGKKQLSKVVLGSLLVLIFIGIVAGVWVVVDLFPAVERVVPTVECVTDDDCSAGETCANNNCVAVPEEKEEGEEAVPSEEEGEVQTCHLDAECGDDYECWFGECIKDEELAGGGGTVCGDGECVIGEDGCFVDCGCTSTEDCAQFGNYACSGGVCYSVVTGEPTTTEEEAGALEVTCTGETADQQCLDAYGEGYSCDTDTSACVPACFNGEDDDEDGYADLKDDGCASSYDTSEEFSCANTEDDDADATIDNTGWCDAETEVVTDGTCWCDIDGEQDEEVGEYMSASDCTSAGSAASATYSYYCNLERSSEGVTITADGVFEPLELVIFEGETVTWENKDDISHQPASNDHPTHVLYSTDTCSTSGGSPFDACAEIASGGDWSFTFDQLGTWGYHDHLYYDVTGTIVVLSESCTGAGETYSAPDSACTIAESEAESGICVNDACGAYVCASNTECYTMCGGDGACQEGYVCDTDTESSMYQQCVLVEDCNNYVDDDTDGTADYTGGCDSNSVDTNGDTQVDSSDLDGVIDSICGCYDTNSEFVTYSGDATSAACPSGQTFGCSSLSDGSMSSSDCAALGTAYTYYSPDSDCVPPYAGVTFCTSSSDCDATKNEVCISYVCYATECADGVDNDGDGTKDYASDGTGDSGCTDASDTTETEKEVILYAPPAEKGFFARVWEWIVAVLQSVVRA